MRVNLTRRPVVHELCMPAFLQEPIRLSDSVIAVPSVAFGTAHLAEYLVRYAEARGVTDEASPPPTKGRWSTGTLPVTALVLTFKGAFPATRVRSGGANAGA